MRKRLNSISIYLFYRILVVAAILGAGSVSRSQAGELPLAPVLTQELNMVLNASVNLHKSLVSQNEEQVDIHLRDIVWQLDRAKTASAYAKDHERRHLLRILEAAREHFEMTQTSYGEERRARLVDAFNQLVNLVRIYRVDRAFSIFFCPKDRTTWVQRTTKAQNPFRHDRAESCGLRVPR
jgi:hypothetical protein